MVHSTTAGIASSFGVSSGNSGGADPATTSAWDILCTGNTVIDAAVLANNMGLGDYLEIGNMQNSPITDPTAIGAHRICGGVWNAITGTAIGVAATVTICSRDTPFR